VREEDGCTPHRSARRKSHLDLRAPRAMAWRAQGRPPKAEPGADAGPAAPLSGVLMSQALLGTDLAAVAKVERPAGRMTLATGAWFAGLARVDGGRGEQASPAFHRAALANGHPGAGAPPPEASYLRPLPCQGAG
jgi:hypothetical protein